MANAPRTGFGSSEDTSIYALPMEPSFCYYYYQDLSHRLFCNRIRKLHAPHNMNDRRELRITEIMDGTSFVRRHVLQSQKKRKKRELHANADSEKAVQKGWVQVR